MAKYIARRLAQLAVVLLGVTLLTFAVARAAPSDAAEMEYISRGIIPSQEQLAHARAEMGLDRPFAVQYANWLWRALHGELGISSAYNMEVWKQLTAKLPGTLLLAGVSMAVTVAVAFPLGILCAVRKNRFTDYVIRFVSFVGISMPGFWLGLLLMYLFCVVLGWLNVIGRNDFKGMILPVATLSIPMISSYVRQIRAAVLEELSREYVVGARARGVKGWRIILQHVLPNSLPPIITLLGLSVGHLLGGAAVVETVFSWQGIGSMAVEAIRMRDYPLIQAYVLWMAVIYVLVNLAVDISCHLLDPQIRYEQSRGGGKGLFAVRAFVRRRTQGAKGFDKILYALGCKEDDGENSPKAGGSSVWKGR